MAEPSDSERVPRNPPPAVLVVDDEADLRGAIRDVLVMRGCSVDTAENGPEALRRVLGRDYNVVISDIRLPQMDGLELARRLNRRARPPCIILITAYSDPATLSQGYSAGAAHVLPKPISLVALVRLVEGLRNS